MNSLETSQRSVKRKIELDFYFNANFWNSWNLWNSNLHSFHKFLEVGRGNHLTFNNHINLACKNSKSTARYLDFSEGIIWNLCFHIAREPLIKVFLTIKSKILNHMTI